MGRWMKDNWWVALAALAGAMFTVAGAMAPFEGEVDGGLPWWAGMLVMLAFGALLLGGAWFRRRNRVAGDVMIAFGTLPLFPLFWTLVLPLVGLLILIPALLDAADARATSTPGVATEPRDAVTVWLLALTLAAVAAALAVGTADAAVGLVSPPLALFAAHVILRHAAVSQTRRLGMTGVLAGIVHGMLLTAVVVLGDNGIVDLGSGLAVAASTVMAVVLVAGMVLAIVGRPARDTARPA